MAQPATKLNATELTQRKVAWALMGGSTFVIVISNIIYNLYQSRHASEWVFSAVFAVLSIDALALVVFVVGAILAYTLMRKQRRSE